jgi:iron complex transport system permease protein
MNEKKHKDHTLIFITLSLGILLCLFMFALMMGRYHVSFQHFMSILMGDSDVPIIDKNVVVNLRIPRTIIAMLTGAALSLSGLVYQEIFNNKLVSPDLLGVSSGASVGAAFAIVLGLTSVFVSFFSFIFGLATVFITISLSKIFKSSSSVFLLLTGIIVGGFMSSATGLFKYLATSDRQLSEITFWLLGSFSSSTYEQIIIFLPIVIICIIILFFLRWRINILALGHDEANSLGVNYKLIRTIVIIAATLLTASSVSISGVIGWIGLVIPIMVRLLVGRNTQKTIPIVIVFGAIFMILVDIISRSFTSVEIPLSVVTGFLGTPVFMFLLFKKRGVVSERH